MDLFLGDGEAAAEFSFLYLSFVSCVCILYSRVNVCACSHMCQTERGKTTTTCTFLAKRRKPIGIYKGKPNQHIGVTGFFFGTSTQNALRNLIFRSTLSVQYIGLKLKTNFPQREDVYVMKLFWVQRASHLFEGTFIIDACSVADLLHWLPWLFLHLNYIFSKPNI